MPVSIIPAILPKTWEEFETKFSKVKDLVSRVQLDVVDGFFAPEKTIGPEELVNAEKALRFDVHLMVDDPIKWLVRCDRGGADRVFGQIERMPDMKMFVAEGQLSNMYVGLALDLDTPAEKIADVIDEIDGVLLMSVKAGQSGQEFMNRMLPKIEEVRALREDILICIDGGLDTPQIKQCIVADWAQEIKEEELHEDTLDLEFAVGDHLWNAENLEVKLEQLRYLRNG